MSLQGATQFLDKCQVSMNGVGDIIVVSGILKINNQNITGAQIYKKTETEWNVIQTIDISGLNGYSRFKTAWNCKISEDSRFIFIGTGNKSLSGGLITDYANIGVSALPLVPENGNPIYVYKRNGDQWNFFTTIFLPASEAYSMNVNQNGTRLICGSPTSLPTKLTETNRGRVYVVHLE